MDKHTERNDAVQELLEAAKAAYRELGYTSEDNAQALEAMAMLRAAIDRNARLLLKGE